MGKKDYRFTIEGEFADFTDADKENFDTPFSNWQAPLESTANVPLSDILAKLKLSRNYITRNISHVIPQTKTNKDGTSVKGATVVFDGKALRRWLINKATFTRQTRRINVKAYLKKYPHIRDVKQLLGPIPPSSLKKAEKTPFGWHEPPIILSEKQRGLIPPVNIVPFDFFDKKLIFPKEYYRTKEDERNGKTSSFEACYRDMFLAGAVKIQLGSQKTMFYLPKDSNLPPFEELIKMPVDSDEFPLVTADWYPEQGAALLFEDIIRDNNRPSTFSRGVAAQVPISPRSSKKPLPSSQRRYRITVEFDPRDGIDEDYKFSLEAIKKALQKGLQLDRDDALEIHPEENRVSASYIMHFPKRGRRKTKK